MSLRKDDAAQMHTMEGIIAALTLIVTLLFVTNSITFVSPQTEKTIDINTSVMSQDILNTMNVGDLNHTSQLKQYVLAWNGTNVTKSTGSGLPVNEPSIKALDTAMRSTLSPNINYSVTFSFVNGSTQWENDTVISHGQPYDNAVSAYKVITLNPADISGSNKEWGVMATKGYMPTVVVVKLSVWYI